VPVTDNFRPSGAAEHDWRSECNPLRKVPSAIATAAANTTLADPDGAEASGLTGPAGLLGACGWWCVRRRGWPGGVAGPDRATNLFTSRASAASESDSIIPNLDTSFELEI
jgi:hypothetical protein